MDQLAPLLELRAIRKSFGGTPVLHNVSFDLCAGEVHALVGENGAGKSTLMNIVGGVMPPDSGGMLWRGHAAAFHNPREARDAGIGFVHQELALVPHLSVAENIFLGRHLVRAGLVDFGSMCRRTREVMDAFGRPLDPRRACGELSLAECQLVEIARAVAFDCNAIVMDEPTAPLDDREAEALFRVIRLLRARGTGIIYISHRLREIFEVSDRVTVLRDGHRVLHASTADVTQPDLVRAMIGGTMREPIAADATASVSGEALRVEGAARFCVRRGEIVGLAGLAGAGRTRLLESIFGAGGAHIDVFVEGRRLKMRSPMDAVRAGLALAPDDRKRKGLVLGAPVKHNIALAGGRRRVWIRRRDEARAASELVAALRIKTAGLDETVEHLSGGTQQKVVLAKWLYAGAKVFLLDEPTRGIDVGAKVEIHEMIRTLARKGAAVLVASSDREELSALANRIVVLHRGHVTGELAGAEATDEAIMHLATGGGR